MRSRTVSFHNLKDYMDQQKVSISNIFSNEAKIKKLLLAARNLVLSYEVLTSRKRLYKLLGDHTDSKIASLLVLLTEKYSVNLEGVKTVIPVLREEFSLEELKIWSRTGLEFNLLFCIVKASSIEFTPVYLRSLHQELKKIHYCVSLQKLHYLLEFNRISQKTII